MRGRCGAGWRLLLPCPCPEKIWLQANPTLVQRLVLLSTMGASSRCSSFSRRPTCRAIFASNRAFCSTSGEGICSTVQTPYVTLSFYRFVALPSEAKTLEKLRLALLQEWGALGVLGRVYLSPEGINAQCSVPRSSLQAFVQNLNSRPPFADMSLNMSSSGQVGDYPPTCTTNTSATQPESMEEEQILSTEEYQGSNSPAAFTKLHVRVRQQIVTAFDHNLTDTIRSLLPYQDLERYKDQFNFSFVQEKTQSDLHTSPQGSSILPLLNTPPANNAFSNAHKSLPIIEPESLSMQPTAPHDQSQRDLCPSPEEEMHSNSVPETCGIGPADTPISENKTQICQHLGVDEWHAALADPNSILVDVRNYYESEIGRFEGALYPPSISYRESFGQIHQLLQGKEDKRILLYCTGGIRCEKMGLYLREQGFSNVQQLKGGIVEYAREVAARAIPSLFKGKNFSFDNRLGERVTEDVLSNCHQCGKAWDGHTNCRNDACSHFFIQCDECRHRYQGTCGEDECMNAVCLPPDLLSQYLKQSKNTKNHFRLRMTPRLPFARWPLSLPHSKK